jgi:limonene-1,2-epoxide hydrolase
MGQVRAVPVGLTFSRRLDGRELNLPCCNVFGVHDGVVNDYRIYMDVNPVLAP